MSRFNGNASVTCTTHMVIGSDSGIGWNANVLDGNMHELTVAGVPWRACRAPGCSRTGSATMYGSGPAPRSSAG